MAKRIFNRTQTKVRGEVTTALVRPHPDSASRFFPLLTRRGTFRHRRNRVRSAPALTMLFGSMQQDGRFGTAQTG
ncbi:MAG: hypothetical protein SNJ66_08520 [Chloroherpetonaceae bacterium]